MTSDERAARVLELVRGLTTEVHPHAPFDDLGIGSLELAELLMRVQDTFGITPSCASRGTGRRMIRRSTDERNWRS